MIPHTLQTPVSGTIDFVLNGVPVRTGNVTPRITLLDWLRDHGHTGTKSGCNEGDCGACTVAMALTGPDGTPCWRSVNSCLLPLSAVQSRQVLTVEGVGRRGPPGLSGGPDPAGVAALHPIQSALVRHHGSQCGFCTPGIVMSLYEAFHRDDLASLDDLDGQLAGNLCRCTGYRSIRAAALDCLGPAFRIHRDPIPPAGPPPPVGDAIRTAAFQRPEDLRTLLDLLDRHPEARLIAGGTEPRPEISRTGHRFECEISLERVQELTEVRALPDAWYIGGAVSLTTLGECLRGEFPALDEMLRWFGSRQIRNRATLGGNLCTGSPVGDAAPVLLTMDAQLVLTSAAGERILPITSFFTGYRQTALRRGEILRTILLPRADGFHRAFYKVSRRREVDISTVSACFALALDAEGRVREMRIGCGGVAAMPMRAHRTEEALRGQAWNADTVRRVLPVLAAEFDPRTDVRATRDYRIRVLTGLLERFAAGDASPRSGRPLPAAEVPLDAALHESAHLHVTGRAKFVDDAGPGLLQTQLVLSPHARARITHRDAAAARKMPGVAAILFADAVPGVNDVGHIQRDEPLLAGAEVHYHGQPVALVVADTVEQAREAALQVRIDYEPQPALTDLRTAVSAGSFHTPAHVLSRGDVSRVMDAAPLHLAGEVETGAQDHFYLETQVSCAEPGEDGTVLLSSSTQHPSEVQAAVARVLGCPLNRVVVQCPRLGGGFGGKESQAAAPAALAALAATITGRRVRVGYSREQDMTITGKRHPFLARFEAGFSAEGRVLAVRAELFANGGWSLDLSRAVADRAILHFDNAYHLPAVEVRSTVARTNLTSQTAFRGFGGPQGMLVIEDILDRIARHTGLPPEVVRERNLYHGHGETQTTHYGQLLEDDRIQRVWNQLKSTSDFHQRRAAVRRWNDLQGTKPLRRGLAITPVKFGISFTLAQLNQAGASVLIYRDGTVQVNHGGTEMGQGIHTHIIAIAAQELGIPPENIRPMPTRTDKIPNTSATAASCSTDLNGMAIQEACRVLWERLEPYRKPGRPFAEAVEEAYAARVNLMATGYHRTPGIFMDWTRGVGHPFQYFAIGAAVSEVEVDGWTGASRLIRVDLLQDVGAPINAAVCRGQIEGGFVQGLGWVTGEEVVWDSSGRLLTHSADTYKIPTIGDVPIDFRVAFLGDAAQVGTLRGSKAVGEPPFMLALSVREAIRDAIAAFGIGGEIHLPCPATAEAILGVIRSVPK